MKATSLTALLLLFILSAYAQEWKNLRTYAKETGFSSLQKGCWLKKDRKRNTLVWQEANYFNLAVPNANEKYQSIQQIRDFYHFSNEIRMQQGHEIKWMGIASVAAGQLAKIENCFLRVFIVRNKEVVNFAHKGSKKVFAFAFPKIHQLYTLNYKLTGETALYWDEKYGMVEQCEILEPLYEQLSAKAIKRLDRMAKGKGIFRLGVPRKLRFEGNILNCKDRYEHGKDKLIPYCDDMEH